MISKINNAVNFGALKYDSEETRSIINSEFRTPAAKKVVQDIFERIDTESTKKGVDIVLEGHKYEESDGYPSAIGISAHHIDDYIAMATTDEWDWDHTLGIYGDNTKEKITDEAGQIEELQRFGAKVLDELPDVKPSIISKLKSFKNIFD